LKHYVSPRFWALYESLPSETRALADKTYQLLKADRRHPSLHFKKLGKHWSVRVGAHFRALAVPVEGDMYWIWIGSHAEYDKLIS
jgi:hypothetical protein